MTRKKVSQLALDCCPVKTTSEKLPNLSGEKAKELESLFKVLGNRTRLQMIHVLIRKGSLCVSDIAKAVNMKPQAVSNQLQRLSDQGILASERNGNNIHYRIVDPCVLGLFDQGLCLLEDSEERKRWQVKIQAVKKAV
jgi:DNA-binding transcriptional ArsR family regulator